VDPGKGNIDTRGSITHSPTHSPTQSINFRDGLFDDKVIRTDLETLKRVLEKSIVVDVLRKGKYLWLKINGCGGQFSCLLIHFGMTGSISIDGVKRLEYMDFKVDELWPPRYCKFEMIFDNKIRVAMTDARRLGRIELIEGVTSPLNVLPLSKLGKDPILEPLSLKSFSESILKRGTSLKALLLNQQMIYCGIGNWLCDDICYEARIHPAVKCSNLSQKQISRLHKAIRNVCTIAIRVNADSSKFPKNWLFHVRWRKSRSKKKKGSSSSSSAMKLPNGHIVTFETIAGRTTALVKSEQRHHCDDGGDGGDGDSNATPTTTSKYFSSSSSKKTNKKKRKRK